MVAPMLSALMSLMGHLSGPTASVITITELLARNWSSNALW